MFSHLLSATFLGIQALPIEVEVDVSASDKLTFIIVGLPDTAVKESKDRVLTALKNSGFSLNFSHFVINLAPGDVKKEGPLYDLPIALGLLQASKLLKSDKLKDYLTIGELSLSGELRGVHGALLTAELAKKLGKKGILVPWMNAHEAALIKGIDVIAIKHLKDAILFFEKGAIPAFESLQACPEITPNAIDFSDIKGHFLAKRALEIAASGGHNILLSGPPGSGKTLLAKALLHIMPALSVEESLEVTKIHSVAGLLKQQTMIQSRPFRLPHHTISYAGLIGGGTNPRPGEVSLAHGGILFLDELPEFSRHALEVLRQPLEDRQVTISRANGNFTFPTNFILVAAMNPCPCGYLGHPEKPCKDSPKQVQNYRNKISGPLLDRIDMHVEVPQIKQEELFAKNQSESSSEIKKRVISARERQYERFGSNKTNSQMSVQELKKVDLNRECEKILKEAMKSFHLTNRSIDRLVKVALTIADLEKQSFCPDHLLEAIQYRFSIIAN